MPDDELDDLTGAAGSITGSSSKIFTPGVIQEGYSAMISQGGIYVFPTHIAGGTVAQGGITGFGGGTGFTAFRQDVWDAIVWGKMGQVVGTLGFNICTTVGHEGVHIQQTYNNLGVGATAPKEAKENQAYGIKFKC